MNNRCAIYARVSTADQSYQSQLLDLRALAAQRGLQIVTEYTDTISGVKASRPGLNQLMNDAHHGRFDVVAVWSFDRVARSVRHLLDTIDTLHTLGVRFISLRENIDTAGPLGRAVMTIIGAIAELERNLIIERVKCGMRRARLEGRQIGRRPIEIDRTGVMQQRGEGRSLGQIAKAFGVSRATISRVVKSNGHLLVTPDPDAAAVPD